MLYVHSSLWRSHRIMRNPLPAAMLDSRPLITYAVASRAPGRETHHSHSHVATTQPHSHIATQPHSHTATHTATHTQRHTQQHTHTQRHTQSETNKHTVMPSQTSSCAHQQTNSPRTCISLCSSRGGCGRRVACHTVRRRCCCIVFWFNGYGVVWVTLATELAVAALTIVPACKVQGG